MSSAYGSHAVVGVEFHRTEKGRFPVQEFIGSLPTDTRSIVYRNLGLLVGQRIGVDSPRIKHIRGKLLEYRIPTDRCSYRVFFYIDSNRVAVLLHAVPKKRSRLPQRVIDLAEARIPR